MKIRPVRLKIADLQQEMQGNPNSKSHIVTIPYILSSHSVTPPYILFGNGVEPLSVFKSRRVDKSRQVIYAFGNVHYVNVKPSIFDVIDRLSTNEYQ